MIITQVAALTGCCYRSINKLYPHSSVFTLPILTQLFMAWEFGSRFSLLFLASTFLCSGEVVEKAALDLYYESLCPYSANFIVNELADVFNNGLIDIVDLKLFPWGNAKLRPDTTILCQHGPSECLLNTIEACAIDAWPSLDKHFPFIYCVEKLAYERKFTQWETCFGQLGLDPKPVTDCYASGYGKELDLKYAAITGSLQPPHKYVPWVVVNSQPLYEDYENFTSYVCKAYKGSLPSVCSHPSSYRILNKKTDHAPSVSYIEETAKVPFLTSIRSIRLWMLRLIGGTLM